jgi:hypothetical protein
MDPERYGSPKAGSQLSHYSFTRRLEPVPAGAENDYDALGFVVPVPPAATRDGLSWREFFHSLSVHITRVALAPSLGSEATFDPRAPERVGALELETIYGAPERRLGRFVVAVVSDAPSSSSPSCPSSAHGSQGLVRRRDQRELKTDLRFEPDGFTKLRCRGNAAIEVTGVVAVDATADDAGGFDEDGTEDEWAFLDAMAAGAARADGAAPAAGGGDAHSSAAAASGGAEGGLNRELLEALFAGLLGSRRR